METVVILVVGLASLAAVVAVIVLAVRIAAWMDRRHDRDHD